MTQSGVDRALAARTAGSSDAVGHLVAHNRELLRQGGRIVLQLDDQVYTVVGAQFRHCLDFYLRLIDGLRGGRIDYAPRDRDAAVERDRKRAMSVARTIARQLSHVDTDRLTAVRSEWSDTWSASSLARELDVAAAHTIHHYAIIALLLRNIGIAVPEDFGVSPSTIRHRNARS